jgi:hypothetical protein
MKKVIYFWVLPLMFLFACFGAHAQIPCGTQIATGAANVPPVVPSNYTNFYNPGPNYNTITLPVGKSYQDTDFGGTPAGNPPCTIYRESGTSSGPPTAETIHAYKYSPINCTDDLELVGTPTVNGWTLINIPSGTLYQSIPNSASTGMQHDNNAQPVWAHCGHGTDSTDKYTLYWHDAGGPRIYKYRADLGSSTVIHDFSADTVACGSGGCKSVCWGCSSNGPHQGMPGNIDDTIQILAQGNNGNWYSFVYDLRNARIWPGFTPIDTGSNRPGITGSFPDHWIALCGTTTGGALDFYDSTGTFVRTAAGTCAEHNEMGSNSAGHDAVYFQATNTSYSGLCTHQAGIVEYDVSASRYFCVADIGWGDAHLSVTQDGKWLALEHQNGDNNQQENCTNYYYNVTNPTLNWSQYYSDPPGYSPVMDEILMAATDGSYTYRMGHHRTRGKDNSSCSGTLDSTGASTSGYDYWAQPKTAVSYDGRYVAFDSNFGVAAVLNGVTYADAYILDTGLSGTTTTSTNSTTLAPPTNLKATVQ